MASAPIAESFALDLDPKSANRGLVRRLIDGALKPDERMLLDRVELILGLEHDGLKMPAIAKELGLTTDKLRAWTRTEQYRIFRKYLAERQVAVDDASEHDRRRRRRREWERFGDDVLAYYRSALKRDRKGAFVDPDRAERAAKLYAQGEGWDQPSPVAAKPREMKAHLIQAQMAAIAAADRNETVVRVTVGDTTVEVGSRPAAPPVDTYEPKGDEL